MFDEITIQFIMLFFSISFGLALGILSLTIFKIEKERRRKLNEIRDRELRNIRTICHPDRKAYQDPETGETVYETFNFKCIDGKSGKKSEHEYIIKRY